MISFKQSDLDELRNPSRYLSDVFIEFYFTYLSSIHPSNSILFVPPTISFLVANLEDKKDVADCVKPLELHTKDLIFFPVNNGGIHWSLLLYCRQLNVFAHHDSLGGLNNNEAQVLYLAVRLHCVRERQAARFRLEFRNQNKRRLMDGPSVVPVYKRPKTPRQTNGFDCGLYVMAMAKAICGWFCSGSVRETTWMREIEKLDDSLGITMRPLVMQLIREASEGGLGSVSCTIEEERRDGNIEADHPVDSETTTSPNDLPKILVNASPSLMEEDSNTGNIPLKNEEAVNDNDMVPQFPSCDSTPAASSIVVENQGVKDTTTMEEKDMENILDTTSNFK